MADPDELRTGGTDLVRRQALVTVVIGTAAWIAGSLVVYLGSAAYAFDLRFVVFVIVGWRPLIWIGLVILIAWRFGRDEPRRRARLAVIAALVAVVVDQLIEAVIGAAVWGGGIGSLPLSAISVVSGLLTFGACAAVGAFGALGVLDPARRAHRPAV